MPNFGGFFHFSAVPSEALVVYHFTFTLALPTLVTISTMMILASSISSVDGMFVVWL
jgi:hypothetical protein